jgi:selT/selW/selH-like putative selenoprotein
VAVEIHYCPVGGGYDRRAASLAAVLNGNGFSASIVEGAKSQYDVISDGELVFSKQRAGRFPEENEVLELLASSR